MLNRINSLAGIVLLAPIVLAGQIRIVTATRDGEFPVLVYKVTESQHIEKESELPSDKQFGVAWVGYSFERKLMVLLGGVFERTISAVDLHTGAVVKKCIDPSHRENETATDVWLINTPGRGLTIVENLASGGATLKLRLWGMSLDPETHCGDSFFDPDSLDLRYVEIGGAAGVADVISFGQMGQLKPDAQGELTEFTGTTRIYLDLRVPAELWSAGKPSAIMLVSDDSRSAVVKFNDFEKKAPGKLLVYRKSDKTWHTVPAAGDSPLLARSFGRYLSVTESMYKTPLNQESPGRAAWRNEDNENGVATAEFFDRSDEVFPGRLHVYDIQTEALYTIDTKQGDSEILLIEDGEVYYRSADSLYAADLKDGGIGTPRLLATDDAIRDAHWAFLKR
jgi:hypothetical protein